MPANYRKEFGDVIREAIAGITHPEASEKTEWQVSPSYWTAMKAGQVPSPTRLRAIAEAFPAHAERLYEAAGLVMPPDLTINKDGENKTANSYCIKARAIAEHLGVSKEEAIMRAVDRYAQDLAVSQ